MIKNYLKIAIRNLARNYLYVIVNLLGLSLGIACSIVAYVNWEFHKDFDGQHENASLIHKVNTKRNFEGEIHDYGVTPLPLSSNVGSIHNISASARYSNHSEVIKLEDKVVRQQVGYADPSFLKIFSFELLNGTPEYIKDVNHAYITEMTAITFYGESDPVGQRLLLRSSTGQEFELSIAGVIKDHPLNSSFKFDILLNYESYIQIYNLTREDWGFFSHATFLFLDDPAATAEVEEQLQRFIDPINETREDWEAVSYYLVGLDQMANEARYIRSNHLGQNNPEGAIMIPIIMGIIILLVACVNFMNTSIALSSNRLKEIGVRKAIGANRSQLITQLLTENIILIIVSLGFGIFMAELLMPLYSRLGPWIDLEINYSNNFIFFGFLTVLLLLTAILSGAYPAFYVSKFNAVNIFNGRFRLKNSGVLSKILIIMQLAFSLIALIQGIVYVQNTWLQKNFDLGYQKYGVITIPVTEGVNFTNFRDELQSYSAVSEIAGTYHHVGYNLSTGIAEINAKKNEIRVFDVGQNYIEAMRMDLVQGRNFLKDSEVDLKESVVVNEEFLKTYKLDDPIDQRVILDDKPYHVVGVIKDFYPYGLWKSEAGQAMVLKMVPEEEFLFIVANVVSPNIAEVDRYLEKQWKAMFPNSPYESELENIHVYRSELLSNNMAVMNIFLAGIALFLSAVGLFTIISINILKRTKEIGLRKIMGASTIHIVGLINRGFVWILLLAILAGTMMGTYLTEMFLDLMYSIHSHVGIISVGATTLMILLIVGLTSGYKIVHAANSNPVDALKYE